MGHARIGARDLARRTENSPLDVKNLKTRNCSLQNQNGSSKGSFAYNSELLDGAFPFECIKRGKISQRARD